VDKTKMSDETKPKTDHGDDTAVPKPANDDNTVHVDDIVEGGFDESDDEFLEGVIAEESDDDDDEDEDAGTARITELEGQVSDLTDRLLRAAAEIENVRKRAQKDREDASKFATAKFAEDMLAVADNMSRALEAVTDEARNDSAAKSLIEGVELTMKELNGALERHGIVMVNATGERFDPNQHQSMFETETLDFEPGTVMQVLRTGYTIHGRLLRPAMVGVAKMPAEPKS
jgi:molecular chaperone GrpE